MTGREYLQTIQTNLKSGKHQHRMGQNVLRAFGYVRRRSTAIRQINKTLNELDLIAEPPIDSNMPLRNPRVRFLLRPAKATGTTEAPDDSTNGDRSVHDNLSDDEDNDESNLPEPGFTVSELSAANQTVERVSRNAPIKEAYTKMMLGKYSQLVVSSNDQPQQQDIKGIVSFQSIAMALMNGDPTTVGDCTGTAPHAKSDADLNSIVDELSASDVVLVIGMDNRLQGIVTAWDLAEEFAGLVNPFKRLGEIETRLQTLLERRLGKDKVAEFLHDQSVSGNRPIESLEQLTMGELQRVLEYSGHWEELELAFDRRAFIAALDEVRGFRNRLMHFGDPLSKAEMTLLTNFCDSVRVIQL